MNIRMNTIRTKLVLSIIGSVVLAGMCMLLLGGIFILASRSLKFSIFFLDHLVMFLLMFLMIFVVLTITIFLLLIRNKLNYLEDITKTLEVISNDNLDVKIPVKTSDELGKMAETVNSMVNRLKISIEEERKLEKLKNDLITNISHDIRTPLTSTLGYLELIDNMKSDHDSRVQGYIGIALNKCRELKILIDYLFEYSKLHNAGMTIKPINLSMGELLEQIMIGFIPAFEKAEMEYRLCFCNEKLMVNVDAVLLTRVFDNLINNAIKYGKEGKYLDISLMRDNEDVVVQIVNYGAPISDVDLPFVFQRFYQADKSNASKSRSSGLGLAIVKRIIDMHHGIIRVESSHEKTVFEVRLRKT